MVIFSNFVPLVGSHRRLRTGTSPGWGGRFHEAISTLLTIIHEGRVGVAIGIRVLSGERHICGLGDGHGWIDTSKGGRRCRRSTCVLGRAVLVGIAMVETTIVLQGLNVLLMGVINLVHIVRGNTFVMAPRVVS